jgi:hypothetical protein
MAHRRAVLEVRCAEADPACHQKAEARGWSEDHEVAKQFEQHEAQRHRYGRLWDGRDRQQAKEIREDERPGERAGGRQESERPPWVGYPDSEENPRCGRFRS